MEAIGGYFELADLVERGEFPHNDGVLLNTGRNALEYILRSIGNVKHVYLPYYTCEVVLEPLKKLNIPYTYYHINSSFEIADELKPQESEYVIANNYYGIKDAYIEKLASQYGDKLIADCAQAFFSNPNLGINALSIFYRESASSEWVYLTSSQAAIDCSIYSADLKKALANYCEK